MNALVCVAKSIKNEWENPSPCYQHPPTTGIWWYEIKW